MTAPLAAVATAVSVTPHQVQELAVQVGLPEEEREKLRVGGLRQVPVADVGLVELVEEVLAGLCANGWRPQTCGWVAYTHSLELTDDQLAELGAALRAALPGLDTAPVFLTGRPCSI